MFIGSWTKFKKWCAPYQCFLKRKKLQCLLFTYEKEKNLNFFAKNGSKSTVQYYFIGNLQLNILENCTLQRHLWY